MYFSDRLLRAEIRRDEPMSVSAIALHLGFKPKRPGKLTSGRARNTLYRLLDSALRSIYAAAEARWGVDSFEAAACVLRLVSKDDTFVTPDWLREKLAPHAEALAAEFAA